MKPWMGWLIGVLAVGGAGGAGYWFGHRAAPAKEVEAEASGESGKAEEKPVAAVTVMPLRRMNIVDQVTAYGTVTAPSNEIQVVSIPYECRVTRMLVTPGQTVDSGQPLIAVQGSAATALALAEAQNAAGAAQRDLQLIKQRYEQRLVTNSDLYAAENTLRTAQGRLQSLQQAGAGGAQQLKADRSGVVSKVDVQPGQIVPIGGPLVEVAAQDRIEVRLGVEPQDAAALSLGQPVALQGTSNAGETPISGKIRMISQRVDPMTRLVDVMVALPPDARLLLETFVTGRVIHIVNGALAVPRNAALPTEEGGYALFTVKDGKAVKHAVKVGVQTDRLIQVIADDLKEGDTVVASGNNILEDGMAVKTEPAPSDPAADAPTTLPAQSQPAPAESQPTPDSQSVPATSQSAPAESQPALPASTASSPSTSGPAATQPSPSAEGGK